MSYKRGAVLHGTKGRVRIYSPEQTHCLQSGVGIAIGRNDVRPRTLCKTDSNNPDDFLVVDDGGASSLAAWMFVEHEVIAYWPPKE